MWGRVPVLVWMNQREDQRARGKGEDQLFEKKLSREEQKAEKERKKAQRCVERNR